MNDKNLGIALTAAKISITGNAIFIPETIYTYIEEEFSFTNGGLTSVNTGDVIRGIKSGTTAIVISVSVEDGRWEDSSASGTIRIKSRSGQFIQNESLAIGKESDIVNITTLPKEVSRGEKAKAIYISVPGSKDSLVDHASVVIAVSGNTLDYNYMLGTVIPEGKKWVLYDSEISKANFISFVQGSKCCIDVIGYY